MESADLESCLKGAKQLGTRAKIFFVEKKFEESLQIRLKEIALLESAYKSDEKNGKVAGYLGETYSSIAKTLYKLKKEDIEYLLKAEEVFKKTFDAFKLPAFAYDTYLFVLRKLCGRAQKAEDKLPYARDYVLVLKKAAREKRYIYYKGGPSPAEDMLPGATAMLNELEDYIKSKNKI